MNRLAVLAVFVLTGCAGLPDRTPLPEGLYDQAQVLGAQEVRSWGDKQFTEELRMLELSREEIRKTYPAVFGQPINVLAISGGGPNGAFSAGLLNGWTETGTRPVFTLVTGVSTGALIAPFAFLGADYDPVLREIYTRYDTDDLVKQRSAFSAFFKDAASDTAPLRGLIEKYFDDAVMQAVAVEYEKGRTLIVTTTNLDAGRAVRWDIGKIAADRTPKALRLIHDVLLASASIPGAFPPVMIEVQVDGAIYDEMHVDGGVTTLVNAYPLEFNARAWAEAVGAKGSPVAYVIRNGYLQPSWSSVERRTLPITTRTIQRFFGSVAKGDLYRILLETSRDDVEFRLAFIPDDFDMDSDEPFDPDYMRALFDLGYQLAKTGYDWETSLPEYEEGLR